MGQSWGLDSGGVHKFQGQNFGQKSKPGRRWVQRNKYGAMESTEVVTNHHQSGGGGCEAAVAGQPPRLQVCLDLAGAHRKITKNIS